MYIYLLIFNYIYNYYYSLTLICFFVFRPLSQNEISKIHEVSNTPVVIPQEQPIKVEEVKRVTVNENPPVVCRVQKKSEKDLFTMYDIIYLKKIFFH